MSECVLVSERHSEDSGVGGMGREKEQSVRYVGRIDLNVFSRRAQLFRKVFASLPDQGHRHHQR